MFGALLMALLCIREYENMSLYSKVVPKANESIARDSLQSEDFTSSAQARVSTPMDRPQSRQRRVMKFKNAATISVLLHSIDDAIPTVFRTKSFLAKFYTECSWYHKYLAVFIPNSVDISKRLHLLVIFTQLLTFLTWVALILYITGTVRCHDIDNQHSCLQQVHLFTRGQHNCHWNEVTEKCVYAESNINAARILYVSIIAALLTTPISALFQQLILFVIGGKPSDRAMNAILPSLEKENFRVPSEPAVVGTPIRRSGIKVFADDNAEDTETSSPLTNIDKEFECLKSDLKRHITTLSSANRRLFHLQWGLDADGDFATVISAPEFDLFRSQRIVPAARKEETQGNASNVIVGKTTFNVSDVESVMRSDLGNTIDTSHKALQMIRSNSTILDEEIYVIKTVMYYFQYDMLTPLSRLILEAKHTRNVKYQHRCSIYYVLQILAWLVCVIYYVGCTSVIYYLVLLQSKERQYFWLLSLLTYTLIDAFFINTFVVFCYDMWIPSCIMGEMRDIKVKILDCVNDFKSSIAQSNSKKSKRKALSSLSGDNYDYFNAAKYFFVSHRIAQLYPDILECMIVSSFNCQSPIHRQDGVVSADPLVNDFYALLFLKIRNIVSAMLLRLLSIFLKLPAICRQVLMEWVCTALIGYIAVISVRIFNIFPAYILIPFFCIALLLHYVIVRDMSEPILSSVIPVNKKSRVHGVSARRGYDRGSGADDEIHYFFNRVTANSNIGLPDDVEDSMESGNIDLRRYNNKIFVDSALVCNIPESVYENRELSTFDPEDAEGGSKIDTPVVSASQFLMKSKSISKSIAISGSADEGDMVPIYPHTPHSKNIKKLSTYDQILSSMLSDFDTKLDEDIGDNAFSQMKKLARIDMSEDNLEGAFDENEEIVKKFLLELEFSDDGSVGDEEEEAHYEIGMHVKDAIGNMDVVGESIFRFTSSKQDLSSPTSRDYAVVNWRYGSDTDIFGNHESSGSPLDRHRSTINAATGGIQGLHAFSQYGGLGDVNDESSGDCDDMIDDREDYHRSLFIDDRLSHRNSYAETSVDAGDSFYSDETDEETYGIAAVLGEYHK
jgi:hypothetical protein